MTRPAFLARLEAFAAPLRTALMRWRRPIVAAALLLFLGGAIRSFLGLGLPLARLDFTALAVLTLGMGLVMLASSALSLTLMARTVSVKIGFVAALQVSARAQLAEVLPLLPAGTELHIAGTRIDRDEAKVLDNQHVRYLGALPPDHLAEAYRQALCVGVPNIVLSNGVLEGFGLVAIEAAAAGGVVVAANCSGIPAAVSDGNSGFLVESGNPAALANTINRLPNGVYLPDKPSSPPLQQVEARYRWPRVAQAGLDAYLADQK